MKKMTWNYKETLDFVRKKRWVVHPNAGFVRQLRSYEVKLNKIVDNPELKKLDSTMGFKRTLKGGT